MKDKFKQIAQSYLGMTPKDKGCENWSQMQDKMADELIDSVKDSFSDKKSSIDKEFLLEFAKFLEDGTGLLGNDYIEYRVNDWISKQKIDSHCVCMLTTSNGEITHKIFSEDLAKSWKLNLIFTGTHDECLGFMVANKN